MLAGRHYQALATALHHAMESEATAPATLAWERDRFDAEGGVFVSAMYTLDLLAVGQAATDPARAAGYRTLAASVAFYTLAVIETDGTRCADPAAPLARGRQFGHIFIPVGAALAALPDDQVADAVANGLVLERRKADHRADDDYLCRGVTDDIPPALIDGAKPLDPHFRAAADWQKPAQATRDLLPLAMTGLAARLKLQGGPQN